MAKKSVTLDHTEIVVNRQGLLDLVRALDIGAKDVDVSRAMDLMREPFFSDEMSKGIARTGFEVNSYFLSAK